METTGKPVINKKNQKRGRKKKLKKELFKAEEVLDYMIRNYPLMGIERIRDNVIDGLKNLDINRGRLYTLEQIKIDKKTYYYDETGTIFTPDYVIYGIILDENNNRLNCTEGITDKGPVKVFVYRLNSDFQTPKQLIESIRKEHQNS